MVKIVKIPQFTFPFPHIQTFVAEFLVKYFLLLHLFKVLVYNGKSFVEVSIKLFKVMEEFMSEFIFIFFS